MEEQKHEKSRIQIFQGEFCLEDREENLPRVCPVPEIDKFPLDGSIPTTRIFEHFADHSELGKYSILLEKRCMNIGDATFGTWFISGFVVSNAENVLFTQRIVATNLRLGDNRQQDCLIEYVGSQLNRLNEDVELGKKVYVEFGLPYPLCAQTETDRKYRKAGSVSELAITGVVATKIEDGTWKDLFKNLIEA